MEKKETIKWIIITMIISAVLFLVFQRNYELSSIVKSPDNEYTLEIYTEKKSWHIGFSSQIAYCKAYVVLKNDKGETISKPACTFIIGDLKIKWELDKGIVHFTQLNHIDIHKRTALCL
ncbi:MAG: hypothetical protein AAF600_14520 [Bacteroidota bacterium]